MQTPKGTHDILPVDAPYWDHVMSVAEHTANFYGFNRIATPHFEKTELFLRTLGETTDIIEKQMYSFRTRGGDSLTLRPEGTASIARAYIQHGMQTLPQPVKLYYAGSFFRHENPQRGRYRELHQFGFEILGEEDVVTDALVIRLMYTILVELGFQNIAVQVNSIGDEESRAAYRKELMVFYRRRFNSLCKDCKRRVKENPLRLLDCKEMFCIQLREEAPQMLKSLSEASKKRFTTLLEFLDDGGIPYFINPYLVRGLDYYTDTVFELFVNCLDGSVSSEENALEDTTPKETPDKPLPIAVAGGGRYDGLIKLLGGKPTPAVGGALGLDRIVMEMKTLNLQFPKKHTPRVFLVQLGPAAKKKTFALLEEFRKAGMPVSESMGKDSIKSQLRIAEKVASSYALILGQKEALDGTVIVREMETGMQETVFLKDVVETVKSKLKGKK
ncbi:MAG: histidyl-tRNA synthetase [Parcubacteria group bacterium Gr01-1014_29]|nr:MAG: histidyl-tRNA synthetase [Parcubacteria group bacterium Gr01-1014_29]